MSEAVQHEHPLAYKAACEVDPMILATALAHIAKTAERSRSKTRRIRWIQQRAEKALRGEEYRDIDVDLPKSAGPDTPEKLQRRMAYHIAIKHELIEAINAALDAMTNEGDQSKGKAASILRDAIGSATGEKAWKTLSATSPSGACSPSCAPCG